MDTTNNKLLTNANVPLGAEISEGTKETVPSWSGQIRLHETTCDWKPTLPRIFLFNPVLEKPRLTTSPIFILGAEYGHPTEWRIQVSHDFWYNSRQRTIAMYLWRQTDFTVVDDEPVSLHYSFDILDKDGNVFCSRENGIRIFSEGSCYGWNDFVNYSDEVHSLITDNGNQIHIRVKMQIFQTVTNSESHHVPPMIGELTTVDVMCDQILIMKADKAILIGKSPEFSQLILSDDGKDMTQVVLINVNPGILKELLDFMHLGSCHILQKGAEAFEEKVELYDLGMEYLVEGLDVACSNSMCQNVTVDSFYQVAIFAWKRGFEDKPQHAKAHNSLKRFLRANLEKIKRDAKFRGNYSKDCGYFIDLLFGHEKEEL